jgi:hypothetical protein
VGRAICNSGIAREQLFITTQRGVQDPATNRERNPMTDVKTTEVIVLIGAGAIGQAIARRVATGKTLLLADINESAARSVATALAGFGFETRATPTVRNTWPTHAGRPARLPGTEDTWWPWAGSGKA